MDPLAILPEEIWRNILFWLTQPKEKLKAYNTYKLWRKILQENQLEWMFSEIFPFVFEYLPKSDILEARLTCKSWKNTIDLHLENIQPSIAAPICHYEYINRPSFRTFGIDFAQTARRRGIQPINALRDFQSQFAPIVGPCTKNPFVSRSLHLSINKMDLTTLNFFETFGVHLYSLRLAIWQLQQDDITSPLQIARFIWIILGYAANLKMLIVHTMQNYEDFPEIAPNKEEKMLLKQQLQLFFDSYPAPPLPHLKSLQVNVHPLTTRALESAYASQLENYVHCAPQKYTIPNNLNNLTDMAWHFSRGFKIDHVNKLKSLTCPTLQRLHIYGTKCGGRSKSNCTNELLFEAIESFKSSLTHLSLFWRCFESNFPTRVDLLLIQQLSLEIGRCKWPKRINFSFLAKLTSLRKLKCVFWKQSYLQFLELDEDNVDLNNDRVEPLNSNIWRLVPSLVLIEIQIIGYLYPPIITQSKIYTRGQRIEIQHFNFNV